jgi:hypothetical protein
MEDKRNINIGVDDDFDRYGIPFATRNNKYYFDSGTGKVLCCTEDMYELLLNIFKNKGRIVDIDLSKDKLSDLILELKKWLQKKIYSKRENLIFLTALT